MANQKHQAQVGIAFILSIAVLVAGVMWFRDFQIGGRYYRLDVAFPTASGLMGGDPVEVQGVPSGKVDEIRYEDGRAVVTLELSEEVSLREGARVAIENVGIMGQKLVAIDAGPPEAPPLDKQTTLHGTYQPGIPQLVAGLSGTFETFERLTVRIDSLLATFEDETGTGLLASLENTARVTDELAQLLSENRAELRGSIHSFSNTMSALEQALVGREGQVGALIDRSARAAARLDSSLTAWDRAVGRADSLLAAAQEGHGTLGRAMTDPALYEEALRAVRETRALIREIREDPGGFVHFSLF